MAPTLPVPSPSEGYTGQARGPLGVFQADVGEETLGIPVFAPARSRTTSKPKDIKAPPT